MISGSFYVPFSSWAFRVQEAQIRKSRSLNPSESWPSLILLLLPLPNNVYTYGHMYTTNLCYSSYIIRELPQLVCYLCMCLLGFLCWWWMYSPRTLVPVHHRYVWTIHHNLLSLTFVILWSQVANCDGWLMPCHNLLLLDQWMAKGRDSKLWQMCPIHQNLLPQDQWGRTEVANCDRAEKENIHRCQ